ncbi:MAG TPA: bifunctional riboflavin kinase/FAD synthetase [Pirellulaceae bacterium]|nr:bifunctional riboflavin kinase/FAD synthetase [Pirellulaceae bacterium]
MQLFRSLDDLPTALRGGAVTISNFDGVHRGHARIIQRLLAKAKEVSGPSIVFTFDPHPVRLLRPDKAPPPLTWTDRKAELLADLGVDAVIAYPTDEALLSLSPEEFFARIVRQELAAQAMVEGPNFYFGKHRAGNIELLAQLCRTAGMQLEIVEPLVMDGDIVSSSRIRALIAAGEVAQARELLTEPYRIRGMVTHGAARGQKIGFPTANVDAIDTLLPAHGVYAGRGYVGEDRWPAAINIGPAPTFGENAVKVEAHLIGFHGSLYGEPIAVDFLSRLRGVQTFAGALALKVQLAADIAATLAATKLLT